MTREELEKYLGKNVEIKLFDGEILTGCLRKSQDDLFKNNPNLYLPKNLYFVTEGPDSIICNSCLFKVSHVTKITVK